MQIALGRFPFAVLLAFTAAVPSAHARTLSSSGEEVEYRYEASFRSLLRTASPTPQEIKDAVEFHAEHVFGVFHSPEYAAPFGYPAELTEGFAGSQLPQTENPQPFLKPGDPYLWIHYRARARMIVLKPVLEKWLGPARSASVTLPLLVDLPAIYLDDLSAYRDRTWLRCTDTANSKPADFSYFYNPYRCPELGKAPLAVATEYHLTRIGPAASAPDEKLPLEILQSDNGNGPLVTFYLTFGFDHLPPNPSRRRIHQDVSWKLYQSLGKYLTETQGFTEMQSASTFRDFLGEDAEHLDLQTPVTLTHDGQRRYFSTFAKKSDGKLWIVRAALFDTTNELKSNPLRSFPKFWKEAWENGDFVYFSGHSGDGKSIQLGNLLKNLEKIDTDTIHFKRGKTQIAFFDSCSSYAYYQLPYAEKNPEGLSVVTFGLVSLFHLSEATLRAMLGTLLRPAHSDETWLGTLREIEKQELKPHMAALHDEPERSRRYEAYLRQGLYPSLLLNVWLPEGAPSGPHPH